MCTNQDGQIWELQSLLHSQVIPTLTWYACTTHSPLSLIRTGAKRLDLNFLCTHKKLISAISICFSKTWQQSTIPAIRLSWLPDLKLRKEKVSMYREKKNPANFFTKETKIRTNFRQNLQWENPNKSQQKNIFWGNKLAFPAKSATFRAWICAGIPVIKPTSLGVLDVWKMPGDVTGAGAFRIPTWKNLPKNLPAASQCVFLTDESCFFFQFLGDSPEKI